MKKDLVNCACFCQGVKSKYPVSVLEGKYDRRAFLKLPRGLKIGRSEAGDAISAIV